MVVYFVLSWFYSVMVISFWVYDVAGADGYGMFFTSLKVLTNTTNVQINGMTNVVYCQAVTHIGISET